MIRGLLAAAALAALAVPAAAHAGGYHGGRLHGAYYFSYGQGQHGGYYAPRDWAPSQPVYRAREPVIVRPAHYVYGQEDGRAASYGKARHHRAHDRGSHRSHRRSGVNIHAGHQGQ